MSHTCMHACRAVEAAAESASDVVGRAFWWSNCIQLRWMLWAMSHGGSLDSEYGQELGGSVDDFDWVMQVWLRTPHSLISQKAHSSQMQMQSKFLCCYGQPCPL